MNRKVLFVDDEKNVLRAVERIFIDDDIDLLFANSAAEALGILESDPAVGVVVSDYRMPGMNGVELLKEVYRRHPRTIRMVLSGFADTSAVVDAINVGHITRFIPKPWNEEELRTAVLRALEEGAGRGPAPSLDESEILDALPVAVIVVDDSGVRFTNRAAAAICGARVDTPLPPLLEELQLPTLSDADGPRETIVSGRRCLVSATRAPAVGNCMIIVLTPADGGGAHE